MSRIAAHFGLWRGAEEGAYPKGSVTDEQRSQRPKWTQPSGPGFLGAVALSLTRHVALWLCSSLDSAPPRQGPSGAAMPYLRISSKKNMTEAVDKNGWKTDLFKNKGVQGMSHYFVTWMGKEGP